MKLGHTWLWGSPHWSRVHSSGSPSESLTFFQPRDILVLGGEVIHHGEEKLSGGGFPDFRSPSHITIWALWIGSFLSLLLREKRKTFLWALACEIHRDPQPPSSHLQPKAQGCPVWQKPLAALSEVNQTSTFPNLSLTSPLSWPASLCLMNSVPSPGIS